MAYKKTRHRIISLLVLGFIFQNLFSANALFAQPSRPRIESMAWSPDGSRLAIRGRQANGSIGLWLYDNTLVEIIFLDISGYYGLAWSPDSRYLAIGLDDPEEIQIWDMTSVMLVSTFPFPNLGIQEGFTISWNPQGDQLAISAIGIEIWDPFTPKIVNFLATGFAPNRNRVLAIAWSPDGTQIVSTNDSSNLILWDVASAERLATVPTSEIPQKVTWNPDGIQFVTGGSGNMHIWDANTLQIVDTLQGSGFGTFDLAWNDSIIAASFVELETRSSIYIWDAETHAVIQSIPNQEGLIRSIAINPIDNRLVYFDGNGQMQIVEIGVADTSGSQ